MNAENNKIIAEFMEWEIKKYSTPISDIVTPYGQLTENQLKFHSDWNWLMEVVEKIENYNEFTNVLFSPQGCAIDVYVKNGFAYSNDCDTKIQSVYNACIEFIKWYNLQNS